LKLSSLNSSTEFSRAGCSNPGLSLSCIDHSTLSLGKLMNKSLLFLATILSTLSVQASTVIDNFDDVKGATNGIALNSINNTGIGGIGFTTKYEQTGSAVAVLKTNDLTLTLANYVSGQAGATQRWSVAATTLSSGFARRTQTRGTPSMYGTIWFTFIASLLNSNGDMALTFNGTLPTSGQFGNGSSGMRVGLGNYAQKNFRGALGVGPVATATAQAELTNIVNGVNGAVTGPSFVPTNGTAGLVLGRIDTDPVSGYPRVSLWYNPDVPNVASLPAPTLTFSDSTYSIVPTTVTRIGYQNVRNATLGAQCEVIDNVKVSDEPNGFDIVYLNAALPTPTISAVATVGVGSEQGPTNVVFTITSDRPVTSDLVIPYTLSGVATNGYILYSSPAAYTNADYVDPGFNPDALASSITISNGQSNATVVLQVIDDGLPEATESVTITLGANPSVYILGASSASGVILDNNDAHTSLQYMFEKDLLPQVWDTNLTASAGTAAAGFGPNSTAYNNTGYGPLDWPSPSTAFSAAGDVTPDNQAAALAQGSYFGCKIAPAPGRAMTLTNFQFMAIYGDYLGQYPGTTGGVAFVRSSVDNFSTDLGYFAFQPAETLFPGPGWYTNTIALNSSFANLPGAVEFRIYFFDDSPLNQVCTRIDNLFISGATAPTTIAQIAVTNNLPNAAQPATPGEFTVSRTGDTSSALTVNYTLAGTASNGVDYVALPGSVTIPAGQSSAPITVTPIDNGIPFMPIRTVILTLTPNSAYGLLLSSSATVSIADNDVYGGLVVYQVNENNNTAPSLASVAAGSVAPAFTNQMTALNAAVGANLGNFGAGGTAGSGHGYGTAEFISAPSEIFVRSSYLTNDEAAAVLASQYLSFGFGPKAGYALNLSRFSMWARFDATNLYTANWALRSSVDNFASDLGNWPIIGNGSTATYQFLTTALTNPVFQHLASAIEFRLYLYEPVGSDPSAGSHYLRMDDFYFQGTAEVLPTNAQQVAVSATLPSASIPGTNGMFALTRVGDLSQALTVYYTMSGTASNGVDYVFLSGVTNFAAGSSNVYIPILVLDAYGLPGVPTKTVTLSLVPNTNYNILASASNMVTIADANVYSGLAVYQFNESSNTAPSLADAAVATIPDSLTNKLTASNAGTGPGLLPFGANNGVNIFGYGTGEYVSPPSEIYAKVPSMPGDEDTAVTNGCYVTFTLAPNSGYALNFSRLAGWIKLQANPGYTATWLLRSSLDGFTTNVLSQTVGAGANGTSPGVPYLLLQANLSSAAFQKVTNSIEFRLYFYTDAQADPNNNDFMRTDDIYLEGTVSPVSPANTPTIQHIGVVSGTVTISFTGASGDPASAFHLQSSATVDGTYLDDNSAIVTGSNGAFQATTAVNGASRFYRIRR
jgi:hypothetical protein